jgi:hypothetical protein
MESEVCNPQTVGRSKPCLIEAQMEASKEINSIFPEALRSRVLEFVQFRNTARMDDLGESSLNLELRAKLTDFSKYRLRCMRRIKSL